MQVNESCDETERVLAKNLNVLSTVFDVYRVLSAAKCVSRWGKEYLPAKSLDHERTWEDAAVEAGLTNELAELVSKYLFAGEIAFPSPFDDVKPATGSTAVTPSSSGTVTHVRSAVIDFSPSFLLEVAEKARANRSGDELSPRQPPTPTQAIRSPRHHFFTLF